MKTNEFKYLTHLTKAKIDDKIDGMLYRDSHNSWYLFHNHSEYKGGYPFDFESLKKEYNYASSWYLGNEDNDNRSVHSIELIHEPTKSTAEIISAKEERRAERRAERLADKRAEQKEKDMKTLFVGEPESVEAEGVTDVSRFISGAEITFTKLSSLGDSSTSPGQLYYCSDERTWFFLSNSNLFCGDKPQTKWLQIKERTGMEYSFSITTRGKNELYYKGSYITFLSVPRASDPEPKPEPIKASGHEPMKFITIDYSSLEEGAEVLFAVEDGGPPSRRLPTRGKLYKENERWYILHNDEKKRGATPPTSLKLLYDGEFTLSWQIGYVDSPYTKLTRLEILSRPKEKIADVPKDRFAIGSIIHCLTPGQFKDKLERAGFAHSGLFERYAGTKARVVRVKSEREIVVSWHDNIEYGMDKNEFQEFYPEYHGREISVDVKGPEKKIEEPGTYATSKPDFTPRFDVGRILTCLTPEHFKSRLGREKFFFGGDFEKLAGTRCKVKHIISTSSIMVEWLDVPIHDFTMSVNEFQDYYPDLRETIDLRKSFDSAGAEGWVEKCIPKDSGSTWKIMSSTLGKFAAPDQIMKMESMDHIDAFAYSMHIKGDTHWEDKFKPDASYKYTPPVHPTSSKLRATSDSDIKGDSVPRKKNIDTLLILGL